MNKTHPIKWVATYKDGTTLHQYKGRKLWTDESKQHRFQEINFKKLAILKVIDREGNIICLCNKQRKNMEVNKKSYSVDVYSNNKKLTIKNSNPHYFHNHRGELGMRMAFFGYGLELIQDYVNEYGIKLASTKLRLLMPIEGDDLSGVISSLKGTVEMSVEFRSFANTNMKMIVKTFKSGDVSFFEHTLINGKVEIDRKIDFNVIELNIGE